MKNVKNLILLLITILIIFAVGYSMTKTDNNGTPNEENIINVGVSGISGTTEIENIELKENQGIEIIRLYVENNGLASYEFDPKSIYLATENGNIYCSDITLPGIKPLTKQTIKSGSTVYGTLTFITTLFSFDYDICFDDGENKYVILTEKEKITGKKQ